MFATHDPVKSLRKLRNGRRTYLSACFIVAALTTNAFLTAWCAPDATPSRRQFATTGAAAAAGSLVLANKAGAEQAGPMQYLFQTAEKLQNPEFQDPVSMANVSVSKSASPVPKWASEFDPYPAPGLQASREPPIRWQPFGPKTDPKGASLNYPAWLQGTWKVKYVRQTPQFPAGFGVMATSLSVAGIEQGTILRLPDVTGEPQQVSWRFNNDDSRNQSHPDWQFTLPSILSSFLQGSQVNGVFPTDTLDGPGLSVVYNVPGFFSREEKQSTVTWLGADSWEDKERGSFLSVEWQRQRGATQGMNLVYDYKVYTALRRRGENKAAGLIRIACFPQATEDAAMEAGGKPATVYENQVYFTRQP